jgi:sec-independent protein translocase protein TatA
VFALTVSRFPVPGSVFSGGAGRKYGMMPLFAFLGTQEIVIVLIIALIIFGPQKLPDIGRQIGSALRELKKVTGDFQQTLDFDIPSRPSSVTYDYNAWNGGQTETADVVPQGETIAGASTAGLLGSVEPSYTVASEGAGGFIAPPGPVSATAAASGVS